MVVSGGPEANPNNYNGAAQVAGAPMSTPIIAGMKVMPTRNTNKEVDYVSGMKDIVHGVCGVGVRARTRTGFELVVYHWSGEWHRT